MPKSESIAKFNAPPVISSLVEKLEEHSETYHRNAYYEALLLRDFSRAVDDSPRQSLGQRKTF